MKKQEAKFQPSPIGDAKIAGDMVSDRLPDGSGAYSVPLRLPIEGADVLVVDRPTGPTTTRSDGARIVGDIVSGMPKVEQNRTVLCEGPVEAGPDSTASLPHRTTEGEYII